MFDTLSQDDQWLESLPSILDSYADEQSWGADASDEPISAAPFTFNVASMEVSALLF